MNLPYYKEVKDNYGFKNLIINNSLQSFTMSSLTFLDDKDKELLFSLGKTSLIMLKACKELLAHNSGKIFQKIGDEFNFPINEVENPLTGNPIEE
jgi:hypothetical protein